MRGSPACCALLALALPASVRADPGDVLGVKEWWGTITISVTGDTTRGATRRELAWEYTASVHLTRAQRGVLVPGRVDPQKGTARTWSAHHALEPHVSVLDRTLSGSERGSGSEQRIAAEGPAEPGGDPLQLSIDVERRVYHLKVTVPALAFMNVPAKVTHRTWRTGSDGKRVESIETLDGPLPMGFGEGIGLSDPVLATGVIIDRPWGGEVGSIQGRVQLPPEAASGAEKLVIAWSFSSKPPAPVELVFEPSPGYDDWRPEAGEDERVPGAELEVTARLRAKGGGEPLVRATSITFTLTDVTRLPGVCLNWPPQPASPATPDLRFEPQANPGRVVGQDGLSCKVEGKGLKLASATITSFDWGAFGLLRARAELEGGGEVTAILAGAPRETALRLPRSRKGSWVADAWRQAKNASEADDSDDDADPPGDGSTGDGLTLFEEYRGLRVDGFWTDGAPKTKELFLVDTVGGVTKQACGTFSTLTGIRVHDRLREDEVDAKRRLNFNSGVGPCAGAQHAVKLITHGDEDCEAVGGPGTPKDIEYVGLPATIGSGDDWVRSVVHELLHCCNVYHHGDADYLETWERRQDASGAWKYHVVGRFLRGQDAQGDPVTFRMEPQPVELFLEPGTPIPVAPRPGGLTLVIGRPHGQHSGLEDCVMRYDRAQAYPKAPGQYFMLTPQEKVGSLLCTSRDGVDFNAEPQAKTPALPSRFKSAATRRGNCRGQLTVNDTKPAPDRGKE